MAFICQKRWRPADEHCDAPPVDARPLTVEPARRGSADAPKLFTFPGSGNDGGRRERRQSTHDGRRRRRGGRARERQRGRDARETSVRSGRPLNNRRVRLLLCDCGLRAGSRRHNEADDRKKAVGKCGAPTFSAISSWRLSPF